MPNTTDPNVWCAATGVCLSTDVLPSLSDLTCKGVTDSAYIKAAKQHARTTCTLGAVDIAVQIALALWQRNTSQNIAEMQQDVADGQMRLAEKLHAHAKLFWLEEKDLVDDAFGIVRADTEYLGLSTGWRGFVEESLDVARENWIHEATSLCLDPDACEDARWQRMSRLMEADMTSFAARQAEARAQLLRDDRYNRQYGVLQMGHGLLSSMMSWQNAALSAGASASSILFGSINSLARETGYWMQYRQPTMWSHMTSSSQASATANYAPTLQVTKEPVAPVINVEVAAPPPPPPAQQGGKATEVEEGFADAERIWRNGKSPYNDMLWKDY